MKTNRLPEASIPPRLRRPVSISIHTLHWSVAVIAALAIHLFSAVFSAKAGCSTYAPGVPLGTVSINGLKEASGIVASRRNPGILWTHNDGSGGAVHAVAMNGAHLATFYLNVAVSDTEDIAVGPGPVSGVSYLYVGDIGGNHGRSQVQVLRIPEPAVDLAWAGNPVSAGFTGVEAFTLVYPDGSYDAESLMVDPRSSDVFIVTKQPGTARVYRTNLNSLMTRYQIRWLFETAVPFSLASGGDISADGKQIVLRREDFAQTWKRGSGESVGAALAQAGKAIPVIGPPNEPNGEGIALLPNGTGYVTISEGANPVIYFFEEQCAAPPRFTLELQDQSAAAGATVTFRVKANGNPAPTYRWRFNGKIIAGETKRKLVLPRVTSAQAGLYKVGAINSSGSARSKATLTVRP